MRAKGLLTFYHPNRFKYHFSVILNSFCPLFIHKNFRSIFKQFSDLCHILDHNLKLPDACEALTI